MGVSFVRAHTLKTSNRNHDRVLLLEVDLGSMDLAYGRFLEHSGGCQLLQEGFSRIIEDHH